MATTTEVQTQTPAAVTMDDYLVIGYDTIRRVIFQCHQNEGETIKDVQDVIGAHQANTYPHIIYTVILEEDFRASARRTCWNPVSHEEAVSQYRAENRHAR
jgi:hypothetical protein